MCPTFAACSGVSRKVATDYLFVSAWSCIRWLLRYIATDTFVGFAWYRIPFGIVVLITTQTGVVTWAQ